MARAPSVGEILDGYRFIGGDPGAESSWEKWDGTPKLGDILDGYRFVGGDPGDQKSWKKPGVFASMEVGLERMRANREAAGAATAPETFPAARSAADPLAPAEDLSQAGTEAWTGGMQAPRAAPPVSDPDEIVPAARTALDPPDYDSLQNQEGIDSARAAGAALMRGFAQIPAAATNLLERSRDLNMVDPAFYQRAITKVRTPTVLSEVTHFFDEQAKWWEAKLPEQYRAAEKKEWVTDDWRLGDAWADPKSYMMGVTSSIPATLVTMLPGMRLAEGIFAKLAPRLGEEAAATAAANAAALAGKFAEGAMEGSQNDIEAREQVGKMTRQQLEQSEAYRDLVKNGMPAELARAMLANDVGLRTLVLSGVATGIFSGSGDRIMAQGILRGLDGNVVRRVVKGAVSEGLLEEAPQGFFGQIMQNVAMREAQPGLPLLTGAANQAAGGAVAGGIMGGAMAAPMVRKGPSASQVNVTDLTPDEAVQRILDAPVTPVAGAEAGPLPTDGTPAAPIAQPEQPAAPVQAGGLADIGLSTPEVPDARAVETAPAGTADAGTGAAAATPALDDALGGGAALDAAGPSADPAAAQAAGAAGGLPGQAQAAGLEDFQTRKGELKTFKSEKAALAYADQRTNRVPGNFRPRLNEEGEWVLSRAIRERSEAQKANDAKLRRARLQVAPQDSLARVIAKLGGVKADELTTDGADPADLKLLRSGVVGRPVVRRNGGLSLDALAELLASHGFDVLDEEGRPDASKVLDLIDQEIEGTPVYTPEGYEYWAARKDEEQQQRAQAERLDTPDEDLEAAGYHELSEDAQDAVSAAIESGADEETDALDDALAASWDEDGKTITDEEADAIFGTQQQDGADSQAPAAAGTGEDAGGGEAPSQGAARPPEADAGVDTQPSDPGDSEADAGADELPADNPHRMTLAAFMRRQEAVFGPANTVAAREELASQHLDFIESALEQGQEVPEEALRSHGRIDPKQYPKAAAKKEGGATPEPGEDAGEAQDEAPAAPAKAESTEARAKPEAPALELTGETENEIRQREQLAAAKAEQERKRAAAPAPEGFVLTGSDSPADEARARGQQELVPADTPTAPDYGRFAGKTVVMTVPIEGGGTASLTYRADQALKALDRRISDAEELLACLK